MFWKSIYGPLEPKVSLQFECCCFDHTNFPVPITRLQLCRSGTRHWKFSTISVVLCLDHHAGKKPQISPPPAPKMWLNGSYIVLRILKNFKDISYEVPRHGYIIAYSIQLLLTTWPELPLPSSQREPAPGQKQHLTMDLDLARFSI